MIETAAPHHTATPTNLTCDQLIERILRLNCSAARAFLDTFNREQLYSYLGHLEFANQPRSRSARWLRPGDTPAVLLSEPAGDA
jgi:hypothetical protein